MEYIALIVIGALLGIAGTVYYIQQKKKKEDKRTPLEKASDALKNLKK